MAACVLPVRFHAMSSLLHAPEFAELEAFLGQECNVELLEAREVGGNGHGVVWERMYCVREYLIGGKTRGSSPVFKVSGNGDVRIDAFLSAPARSSGEDEWRHAGTMRVPDLLTLVRERLWTPFRPNVSPRTDAEELQAPQDRIENPASFVGAASRRSTAFTLAPGGPSLHQSPSPLIAASAP